MKGERSFMGEDRIRAGGGERGPEVLVRTGWEVAKPVDASAGTHVAESATPDMVPDEVAGEPRFAGLDACKIAALVGRDFEEKSVIRTSAAGVPVGRMRAVARCAGCVQAGAVRSWVGWICCPPSFMHNSNYTTFLDEQQGTRSSLPGIILRFRMNN